MNEKRFPADTKHIEEAMDFVIACIKEKSSKKRAIVQATLIVEESIVSVINNASDNAEMTLRITNGMSGMTLTIQAAGNEFDLDKVSDKLANLTDSSDGTPETNAIRNMILHAYGDRLRYKHTGGINTVQANLLQPDRKGLFLALGALAGGVLCGLVLRLLVPEEISNGVLTYFLNPVKKMYLNALSIVIGPVVFFSIVTCISQFKDLRELGKIGAKVMGMFLFTTVLAAGVGAAVFFLIKPGSPGMTAGITENIQSIVESSQKTKISLLDTLMNIVPNNPVRPFLEGNMLQLIFLAVIVGVAVGMIGDYSRPLKELFKSCNQLFLKMTIMIVGIMPLAVFCSAAGMVITAGASSILAVIQFCGVFVLALAAMTCAYCLLISIIGRLNPLTFMKKIASNMLTAFSLGSSNAAMPFNLEACGKLGISPRISSFSIPLGATVNMDGTAIYLMTAGLFLARVFGVELSAAQMAEMTVGIVIISMGAPGIPGSGLICLSVLLNQIGVPLEALSLMIGIDSLMGMLRTVTNVTGDLADTLIVASNENMLDLKKYNA